MPAPGAVAPLAGVSTLPPPCSLETRMYLRGRWDVGGSKLAADFALLKGFPSELVEMPLLMVKNK